MRINVDKTKTMVFGRKMEDNDASIHINGTVLENVESFVYLGSEFTWNNDCSRDIRRRIQMAIGAYSEIQSIRRDKGIDIGIKIQLLDTCVFEVLLYAAETWTIKKDDQCRLLACEMRCYCWKSL